MDTFHQYFQHYIEYGIIVCKACCFAIVPGQISSQSKARHMAINAVVQKELVECIQNVLGVAHTVEDVVFPNPYSPPYSYFYRFTPMAYGV
jgi:hypothetical protein